MKAASPMEIQYEVNGLGSLRETRNATTQPRPHSHNEIEVMLIEQGMGTWLMGGEFVNFEAGKMTVFWAIRPHQIIRCRPKTVINWLTIPLTVFIEWQMPEYFSKAILAGETIIERDPSWFPVDKKAFANWHSDLKSADRYRQRMALLEIEARLGRLSLHVQQNPSRAAVRPPAPGLLNHNYFDKISRIADYVSKHFSEPLTIPDIARAVDMHPTSATKVFKKICGMNLVHYLTQHRILYAQRLLTTTDMKILDVALESGYQSASRFYAAFKEFCGTSPQEFRRSFDLRKVPLAGEAGVWKIGRTRPPREAPPAPANE